MKFSNLFSLNFEDLVKGAMMATLGAGYAIIEPLFTVGNFQVDWANVVKTSVGVGLIYLIKNFLTPPPKAIEIDPEKTEILAKTIN